MRLEACGGSFLVSVREEMEIPGSSGIGFPGLKVPFKNPVLLPNQESSDGGVEKGD